MRSFTHSDDTPQAHAAATPSPQWQGVKAAAHGHVVTPPPRKPRKQILRAIIDDMKTRRQRILRNTGLGVAGGLLLLLTLTLATTTPLLQLLAQATTRHWQLGNGVLLTLLAIATYGIGVMVQLFPCFRSVSRLARHAEHIKWAFLRQKEQLTTLEGAYGQQQQNLDALREENRVLGSSLFLLGQQFHDLAEISGDIFWNLTVDGHIRFVSRTVTAIFGYGPDELINRPVMDFIAHDELLSDHEQEALAKLMNGQAVKISCLRTAIRAKNGKSTPCTLHALSVTDEHGNITGFSGVLILAEKQQIQILQENLVKYLGEQEQGFLSTLATLDDIATSQLHKVTGETENAAVHLATMVQELDDKVSSMLDYLVSSNTWTRNLGTNSQKQIAEDRSAIQELQSFIAGMAEQKAAELTRANEVIGKIDDLGNLVALVHEISQRTNVLAMNAHIIAARAGSQGAQFAVVATEVRKLSGQVQQAANEIGTGITHATQHIRNLFEINENKSQEHAGKEQEFLHHTAQQMLQMGENYSKLLDFNETTLQRIQEWNQELSQRVMALHSGIQFQDITRQQIEQVIRMGERRKKAALTLQQAILTQGGALPPDPLKVDDFLEEYVMEGQRNIHFAKTGKGAVPVAAAPDIEFF